MLKRDRTGEEKQFDKQMKRAIMRLGTQPSQEAAQPNPFPYVLFWDRIERKGQRCRVVPGSSARARVVVVEFQDGFRCSLPRMAIRREVMPCQDEKARAT
jgi:hypothetical protein